jgi:hypothetical protein
VDGTVHSAAAEHELVRGVDDCVHVEPRDVGVEELETGHATRIAGVLDLAVTHAAVLRR